jgi:hypothetical protein
VPSFIYFGDAFEMIRAELAELGINHNNWLQGRIGRRKPNNSEVGLTIGSEASAIVLLGAQLGPRVPNRMDLVDGDSGADGVRSTVTRTVPAPQVRPTKSG